MSVLSQLSIVIPLAPHETAWPHLLRGLQHLPAGAEIIFSSPQPPRADASETLCSIAINPGVRIAWVRSQQGRARQLNAGARSARNEFLWFLHADTQLTDVCLAALATALQTQAEALHYFTLGFHDGPWLMRLTELGAAWRSQVLGLPFGDQGFCLQRDVWRRVGPFAENAAYGEDHLLVWQAARAGVPVRAVGARLHTSARKYQAQGWWRTTLRHQFLTYRQALPQLCLSRLRQRPI